MYDKKYTKFTQIITILLVSQGSHACNTHSRGREHSSRCSIKRQVNSVPFYPPPGKPPANPNTKRTSGSAHLNQTRLDINKLDQIVDQYFLQGLAPSTQHTYESAKRRYLGFCQSVNLPAIPAKEHQLCLLAAFLAEDGLLHKTIKCYLSAVQHHHIMTGVSDPGISNIPWLEMVVRGTKLAQAKKGCQERTQLPMTPDTMLKLKTAWNPSSTFKATML